LKQNLREIWYEGGDYIKLPQDATFLIPPRALNTGEFIDWLNNDQLFKEHPVPWNWK
jgi:hypothetical protein